MILFSFVEPSMWGGSPLEPGELKPGERMAGLELCTESLDILVFCIIVVKFTDNDNWQHMLLSFYLRWSVPKL